MIYPYPVPFLQKHYQVTGSRYVHCFHKSHRSTMYAHLPGCGAKTAPSRPNFLSPTGTVRSRQRLHLQVSTPGGPAPHCCCHRHVVEHPILAAADRCLRLQTREKVRSLQRGPGDDDRGPCEKTRGRLFAPRWCCALCLGAMRQQRKLLRKLRLF